MAREAKGKTWRYVAQGTGRAPTLVWVDSTLVGKAVRFYKPNPWALKGGDKRAGWTKRMSAKIEDVLDVRATAEDISEVIRAIGFPPGHPGPAVADAAALAIVVADELKVETPVKKVGPDCECGGADVAGFHYLGCPKFAEHELEEELRKLAKAEGPYRLFARKLLAKFAELKGTDGGLNARSIKAVGMPAAGVSGEPGEVEEFGAQGMRDSDGRKRVHVRAKIMLEGALPIVIWFNAGVDDALVMARKLMRAAEEAEVGVSDAHAD